ncbi:hypothetical protein LUZ63_016820 [Rhynchospora breviuscula]|uniref:Integrase catalytic domain-containing protein n=1 Tax=Rhynchospora breviuscula TaxID=2022672 RepID=A0A9Q0C0S3_9POAL|nr:hypothetical protein LUZ63_016820 [Rhynchospora breviuscula]
MASPSTNLNQSTSSLNSTSSASIQTTSIPIPPLPHSIRPPSTLLASFTASSSSTRASPNFSMAQPENSGLLAQSSPMVFLNLPIHTKLSRSNFLAWRSQIEPLLHAYGLSSFITSPALSPSAVHPVTGQVQLNPDYLSWYKQDQMILAWLRTSLSESVLAQVVSCSTTFDLWRHLTQSFSASSRARLTELKTRLQTATKGGSSCSEFLQQIRATADELTFVGSPVTDQDLVLTVLRGLGTEYNAFVVAVNTRAEPISFVEVQSLLLSHESLLLAQVSQVTSLPSAAHPNAFYAQHPSSNYRSGPQQRGGFRQNRSRGFRSPHNNGRSRVHGNQPVPINNGVSGNNVRPVSDTTTFKNETCQICSKRGHIARHCWWRCDMRYTDDFQTNQLPPPPPPSGAPQAHVAQTSTSSAGVTDWFLDSGATHHVTSDINNLSSFEPYTGADQLHIGDGKGLQITHIGSVTVNLGTHTIVLSQVLLVPSFTKNLISLSRFLSDNTNLVVDFSSCFCIIKDCLTSKTLLQARACNGLYLITTTAHCLPQAFLGERVDADLWHFRLGHPSLATTKKLIADYSLPCNKSVLNMCIDCNLAKSHKLPFTLSTTVSHAPLELLHADVWGPAPVVTNNGFRYYVVFVDDFTKFAWIFFLQSKDEVLQVFSTFKLQVENLLSSTIKVLRTDGGTEFKPIARRFPQLVHQITCPYTPEQNGIAERKHRHIVELSLAAISHASLPLTLWDEVFSSTVYLINRLPPATPSTVSPYELLFHRSPDYLALRVLGSQCFPFTRHYNQHKLQPCSLECVFIGYAMAQKGYKCLHIPTGRIFVSRHVIFNEQIFPFQFESLQCDPAASSSNQYSLWAPVYSQHQFGPSNSADVPVSTLGPSDVLAHSTTACSISAARPVSSASAPSTQRLPNSNCAARATDQPLSSDISSVSPFPSTKSTSVSSSTDPSPPSSHPMTTRSKDTTRRSKKFPDFVAYLATTPANADPTSFVQASKVSHWQEAMTKEIQALLYNKTWVLVPPHVDQHIVGCKWIFKTKRHANGTIERYKARLVAKGFTQEEGVDYFDTFSPVVRPTTIRIVLAIAVSHHWMIRQLDINNAFLQGELHETVYMQQPPGFVNESNPSHVCLLKKAIYGLKQSPRAWFHTLSSALLELGFHGSKFDPSLFISHHNKHTTIVLVYVDDIIVTGDSPTGVTTLIATLQQRFALKDLGPLNFFLGIAVHHITDGMLLSQKQYILDLLCRTHMANAQPVSTPMAVNTSLSKYDGEPFHDPKLYRAVVGALQYITITRPDITFPVNKCSQFMHSPTSAHWTSVKRILRYLKGSVDHGLLLKPYDSPLLHAYTDSDWAGCPDDRRSTSAFCIYLGPNLISWSSKKQPTVSKSSTEAEYRSLALAGAELIWVQYILHELHITLPQPPVLWCDNIGATYLASNPMFHARTKHVEIDFHFIRERVVNKQLVVKFIPSKDQIADGLTKGLTVTRFLDIRDKLMVRCEPST